MSPPPQPGSSTWPGILGALAFPQQSRAHKQQHHTDALCQNHSTYDSGTTRTLTCSSMIGVVNPIGDVGLMLEKPESSYDGMRISTSALGIVSLTQLGAGRGMGEEKEIGPLSSRLLLSPHIQDYPACIPLSAKVLLNLRLWARHCSQCFTCLT